MMLTFDDENLARIECAGLNARSMNPQMHYSIMRATERSDLTNRVN